MARSAGGTKEKSPRILTRLAGCPAPLGGARTAAGADNLGNFRPGLEFQMMAGMGAVIELGNALADQSFELAKVPY